jgi:hypothetical protein
MGYSSDVIRSGSYVLSCGCILAVLRTLNIFKCFARSKCYNRMFVLLKFFYNQCKAPLFWGEDLSRVQNMKK